MFRRLVLCVPFLYQTTLTSETIKSSDDINMVCSVKTAVYEYRLARQKHDVWMAAVPESCRTAELVELNWVPNLIQKFDSDAALLQCFCRT